MGAVEIDLRRAERRLDPRGMIGARPRIGETPFEGHAIELRLEAVDGDGLGAEPDIALGAEWPRNRLGVAATGEPGDERTRVPRLDPRRAGEVRALRRDVQAAARAAVWVAPGARKSSESRVHAPASPCTSPLSLCSAPPASVTASALIGEPHRDRRLLQAREAIAEAAQRDRRLAPDRFGQAENAIEIDLRRRQRRRQLRLLAERQVGVAAKPDRALLRAVLELDLLHHRRRAAAAHQTGDAPGVAGGGAGKPVGPLHRRLEMRNAALDPDRAVEIGQARLVDGIDREVQLDRAVRPRAARRNPIRITLPGDRERAVALGGADQGAHVAAEAQLFEGDLRAACRIRKSDMTVFDGEMVDRHRIGIETDRRRRPIEPPGLVEADGELGPFHRHVGGPKLAAHQRIEGELDLQGPGARPRQFARPADLDPLQLHRGGRQDMHLDGAGKPHLQAGEPCGLGLESIAVATPIDKKRTDQRRHQRQDDCNRNSEQRRLHAVPTAKIFRIRPPGQRDRCPGRPGSSTSPHFGTSLPALHFQHFSIKRAICLWDAR